MHELAVPPYPYVTDPSQDLVPRLSESLWYLDMESGLQADLSSFERDGCVEMQFKMIIIEKFGEDEGLSIHTDALLGGARSPAVRNNLGLMEVEDISDGIGLIGLGPWVRVYSSHSSGLSHGVP